MVTGKAEGPQKYLVCELTHYGHDGVLNAYGLAVSVNPHTYFQKKTRKLWREMEANYPDVAWRDSKGLTYAIWALPDGWDEPDHKAWARENMSAVEIHLVTHDANWKTVKLAVHPDSPIRFPEGV